MKMFLTTLIVLTSLTATAAEPTLRKVERIPKDVALKALAAELTGKSELKRVNDVVLVDVAPEKDSDTQPTRIPQFISVTRQVRF